MRFMQIAKNKQKGVMVFEEKNQGFRILSDYHLDSFGGNQLPNRSAIAGKGHLFGIYDYFQNEQVRAFTLRGDELVAELKDGTVIEYQVPTQQQDVFQRDLGRADCRAK